MNSTMKIACLVLCAISAVSSGKLPLSAERGLMDFMLQTRTISEQNPQRSLTCFDYYLPVLNAIADEWEASHGLCLRTAEQEREGIDATTRPQRDEIESTVESACQALTSCNGFSGSLDYFGCYVTAGSENSKVLYTVSANAEEILARVREEYRLIDAREDRCTTAAQRAYVENTASTYEELQSCLVGASPVPTTPEPEQFA